MTRFNTSSSKAKKSTKSSERGVYKKPPTSPTMKCIKNLSSGDKNHQFYLSMLKALLPNGRENLTEFEVIQRTIAYIKYLENVLGTSEKQDITALLQQLSVD